MRSQALRAMFVVMFLLGAFAAGQQAVEDYLDVYTVQVKPEKRSEFDALVKKMITANRQNKGDTWITQEIAYGPGNRITMISMRRSYADVEGGMGAFDQAVEKSFGKAGGEKLGQEYSQCIVSSRSELRRRRLDLSSNAPTDAAAYAKLIGDSRWARTTVVHIKPGEAAAFEALEKDLKAAREHANPPQTVLISQSVAGQEGTVYYVTTLQPSLGGLDTIPSIQQMLGDDGYTKFLKTSAEAVADTEIVIGRFLPELSNPPEQIVAAAPDFWNPKPAVAAKANSTKPPASNAAQTMKMEDKEKKQ